MAGAKHVAILPGMTLRYRNITDPAMAVYGIVPVHEPPGPFSGGLAISKPFEREFRPILDGAKQRLGEGVVIADPGRE